MATCTRTAKLVIITALTVMAVASSSADSDQPVNNTVKDFYVNSSSELIPTLEAVQDYVADGSGGYFRVHVTSGKFHLRGPSSTSFATFVNVTNISIVGAGMDATYIDGGGSAGFVFLDVHFLTIANISLTNCSSVQTSTSTNSSQSDDTLFFVEFSVALYLVACSDVHMENVSISESNSVGLAMFNVQGSNFFRDCSFSENGPPASDETSASLNTHGGGGAIVEFSFCRPGDEQCNATSPVEVANAAFEFTNCLFEANEVSSAGLSPVSIYPHGREHWGFGKGGGLAVYFRGRAIGNSITLINCHISFNIAESGGGLYVEFGDQSQENTFTLTGKDGGISRIDNNGVLCARSSFDHGDMQANGGGAKVVFMYYPPDPELWPGYHANVTSNHIQFRDTYVSSNLACYGGGVGFVSSRADPQTQQTNTIQFSNCTFQRNLAAVSAALDISVLHPDSATHGELITPVIDHCVFQLNQDNSRSDTSIPDLAGYQFGNGAVYIETVPTNFSGVNHFTANEGTGLVVSGANVAITTDTSLLFEANTGRRGGALVVIGGGALIAYPRSHLQFTQNQARELGGAIYSEGHFGERYTMFKEGCFIRYYKPTVPPTAWDVSFNFSNNSAAGLQGNSTIHVTSLLPCVWPQSGSPVADVRRALCWTGWVYDGQNAEDVESCSAFITTAPANFNNSHTNRMYQTSLYPGHSHPIPVRVKDDYGNIVSHVVYQLSSRNSTTAEVSDKSLYVTNNRILIYGVPNSTKGQDFFLETLGPRILSTVVKVTILPCPPGYAPENNSTDNAMVTNCKCGYSLYFTCNTSAMTARILPGYCVSYSTSDASHANSFLTQADSTHNRRMIVVQCPATVKKSKPIKLPVCNGSCDIEREFCQGIGRNGTFCSGCMAGHAVDVNDIHDCVKCSDNEYRYGWFVYILTNIVPITIFFVIVALFKISATSAPMYAFVFFAQITTVRYFHNQFPWIFGLSENSYFLQPLLLCFYSIWNLDFFVFNDVICLSPNLTTMYSLLLKYLLALYPMLLIVLSYICIELYDRNARLIVLVWMPFRACLKKFRSSWQPRTSIIDAFAAFLMISYTRIAFITITLLTPAQEYYVYHDRRSEVPDGYVFYFDPQYRYFRGQHLLMGLLALVIGAVFVLAPPVFLVLYPTQVFQKCLNRCSSKCSWQPVHTFADAFQGCFKNRTNNNRDYRYFSGLYLMLRIVILVVYAVEYLPFLQLLLQQIICILAVLLFALVKPYKEAFYNKVDLTVFSLLSIMNSLSFANFTYGCVNDNKINNVIFGINYTLGFLPLLYITVYVVYLLLKWRGVIVVDPIVKELTMGKSSTSLISEDYSSTTDVPDRFLHPENYTVSPPPSLPNHTSSSGTLSSPDAVSGEERERLVINRGRPKQRATEGSYFLKKAQRMKNYSSI